MQLLKTSQGNFGLQPETILTSLMVNHIQLLPKMKNHSRMYEPYSKIKKAIFGLEETMAYGGLMVVLLLILHKVLLGIFMKTVREIYGLALRKTLVRVGHFLNILARHYQEKILL